jgi:hypothetical protein
MYETHLSVHVNHKLLLRQAYCNVDNNVEAPKCYSFPLTLIVPLVLIGLKGLGFCVSKRRVETQ